MLFDVTLPRFAIRQGGEFAVDDDGILDARAWWSPTSRIAVSELGEDQSFVLLGEPGIGKSTAIADAVPARDDVVHVLLDEVSTVEILRDRLVTRGSGRIHTLVLDGLDECPIPMKALTRNVVDRVREAQIGRVVVGCRTSDWYEPLGTALREVLGDCPTLELLPLALDDIQSLAIARGCDGPAFVQTVRDSAVGPLAGLPLTLDLLLRVFAVEGKLHGKPGQLYEEGLRSLAEEPDNGRATQASPVGTAAERFAVASRISATLMLCGVSSVTAKGVTDSQTLAVGLVTGGVEHMPAGDVAVTGELVLATLSTALFSGRGSSGRLGPSHASFAAFLTARYLDSHRLPEHQVRALLTRTSALGRTSVPTRLRETAAWLAALNPDLNGWVVEVDPEAACAHASLITDPRLRAKLVAYLLDHPRPERRLSRRRWRLAYSGLADQLREPLSEPTRQDTGPHLGHPVARRAHTAVEIARSSMLVDALPEIRALVETPGLNPVLRGSAAYALIDLDRECASETLRSLLPELAAHPEHDPDDELRGLVLTTCWPGAMGARDLIAAVARPGREDFIGSYAMFLNSLVDNATDADVVELVREIAALRHDNSRLGEFPRASFALFDEFSNQRRRERRLATSLLERVVASNQLGRVLGDTAWLLVNVASLHEKADLPEALLERAPNGLAARMRRGLVREALQYIDPRKAPLLLWLWRVPPEKQPAWGRGGLLCGDDLPWLFELGSEPSLTGHAVSLLRAVFDPEDPMQQETAWNHRGSAAFADSVGWWFEAVPLDSERATDSREQHQMMAETPTWDGAETHVEAIEGAWRRCREGDYEAFRALCMRLWTDPSSGLVEFQSSEPEHWPGSDLVPFDRTTFDSAALGFLQGVDPSGEEWTRTTGSISWTALVGYAALRERARVVQPGQALRMLTDQELTLWATAVVRNPYRVLADTSQLHAALVAELADRLPHIYAAIVVDWLVLAEMAGELPPDVGGLKHFSDGRRVAELVDLLERCLAKVDLASAAMSDRSPRNRDEPELALRRAQESARSLLVMLAEVGRPSSAEWARLAGDELQERSPEARAIVLAGMLQTFSIGWTQVRAALERSSDGADAFAAEVLAGRLERPWWTNMPDGDLGDLAGWLVSKWGADAPPIDLPTRTDRIKDWRDGVLKELARRATPEALAALARLRDANSSSEGLARLVDEAEERLRDESWLGPSPEQLVSLMQDGRRSMVSSEDDLYRLLLSIADRLPSRLKDLGELLWNESRVDVSDGEPAPGKSTTVWKPKYEAAISAFVVDHLRSELTQGVVVNREVLVRPTSSKGLGLAVDILATGADGSPTVVVPIEVKGNWNSNLMSDLGSQLVGDYLPAVGSKRGIYLCAYFEPADWDGDDSRRRVAARRDRELVAQELRAQADKLTTNGVDVSALVFDVPRPRPSARARPSMH